MRFRSLKYAPYTAADDMNSPVLTDCWKHQFYSLWASFRCHLLMQPLTSPRILSEYLAVQLSDSAFNASEAGSSLTVRYEASTGFVIQVYGYSDIVGQLFDAATTALSAPKLSQISLHVYLDKVRRSIVHIPASFSEEPDSTGP